MSTVVIFYIIGVIVALWLYINYFIGRKTIGEWVFIITMSLFSWLGLIFCCILAIVRSSKDDKDIDI